MSEVVSILGCGWLGLPLAEALLKNNFQVKGSTTTEAKEEILSSKGINAYHLSFDPQAQQSVGDFFNADVIIINIPPQVAKKGKDFHLAQLTEILKYIPETAFIIYVSSTSVYPNSGGNWNETTEFSLEQSGNQILFQAEQMIAATPNPFVIIRAGGLFGGNRMLGKLVEGKTMKDGNEPVNYIHREDVIGIIQTILSKRVQLSGQIFNAVCPSHPTKHLVLLKNCLLFRLEPPKVLTNEPAKNRIIDGTKIENVLSYEFIFRNPVEFTYNLH